MDNRFHITGIYFRISNFNLFIIIHFFVKRSAQSMTVDQASSSRDAKFLSKLANFQMCQFNVSRYFKIKRKITQCYYVLKFLMNRKNKALSNWGF